MGDSRFLTRVLRLSTEPFEGSQVGKGGLPPLVMPQWTKQARGQATLPDL
jgi:hypothetical protein